jgi:transglutaminase-like putative cysteine protease
MPLTTYSSLFGGDWGVYQTVARIKGLISSALRDPDATLRRRAEEILGPTPERDEQAETTALFDFVQSSLHYIDDPTEIELLKYPILIDHEITDKGYFMGDCDDASGYLAALLKSVGYQVQLVIVTPQNADGNDYRHIFVRVWLPKAQEWVALDPTAKVYPMGWEVPNKKERVYDA